MPSLTRCLRCVATFSTRFGAPTCREPPRKRFNFEVVRPNLTLISPKYLHFSAKKQAKLFADGENTYAYGMLPPFIKFEASQTPQTKVTTIQEFEQVLDRNWRGSTASAIVEAFEKIKDFSVSNSIPLSDSRFDKLVDGLMDHCEKLTDEELLRLLLVLIEYPQCEASNSHNFHDVWSCLDDICCWKMGNWSVQKMYTFADVWYKWNLGRLSDFMFEVLNKTTQKPKRLSKNMLLYTFFFLNVNKRTSISFEIEHEIAQRIEEFSPDELGIIALGYFKTQSKIKLLPILFKMIDTVKNNCGNLNEITLTALLKVIRFSQKHETAAEIKIMLDKITEHIPKFSLLTLVHVALTGTVLQIKHEPSVKPCIELISKQIETARVKDIERILLVCSMFDINTEPDFFSRAYEEISKDSRKLEFNQYTRSLTSTLNYFSLRKIYNYELTNKVLDDTYIVEIYGKSAKNIPRDLFSLDTCMGIECPDYSGNRLTPLKRYKAAKWLSEYTPARDQHKRLTFADKAYLDVADCIKSLVGNEKFLRHDHVLPHFSKSDIILCKEKVSGKFVEPFGFENYILGDVKRPFDLGKFEWLAVVILTLNLTVRDTCEPLGGMKMKERQLKAIGYRPIMLYTVPFAALSAAEKTAHLTRELL